MSDLTPIEIERDVAAAAAGPQLNRCSPFLRATIA